MSEANHAIPRIGLGTWDLTGSDGETAILAAIGLGYRHIDTAQSYGTEANVGRAVARSGFDRNDLFVTTKIAAANFGRLAASVDDSLATMGLDHADLVLIHWPGSHGEPPVKDYIADLARVQDAGKARLIGVSNFTRRHIDEAVAEIGTGRLATNQVERHLFLQNRILASHCQDLGIPLTAYIPLGRGGFGETPEVQRIADRHGASASEVALAFLLGLGSIVIPKSADPGRQASNLAAGKVTLDPNEMTVLAALDCGRRFVDPEWGPDWD